MGFINSVSHLTINIKIRRNISRVRLIYRAVIFDSRLSIERSLLLSHCELQASCDSQSCPAALTTDVFAVFNCQARHFALSCLHHLRINMREGISTKVAD
jgi:hypothetical protein